MFKHLEKKYLGAILVCFAASLWGLDSIVLTPRLFKLKVPFVVFMLHFIPFITMTLFIGKREFKNITSLPKQDLFYFFLVALFGGTLGTLAIVKALFLVNFQHLTVVTLLQKAQPIFAIVLARIILKEKIKNNFLFFALLALIGGYIMTFEFSLPHSYDGDNIALAGMYALFAAFAFGSSTVFGKKILTNSSFITALYTRFCFTSIITFLIVLYNKQLNLILDVTGFQWFIFIVIALTSGSMAIMIYYKGLQYITASVATICELAFPISSVLFDYIFNKNLLTAIQSFGAIILLFSIIKISKSQK
ncbi:DMT family transporter [Fusobacterium sp. IOR10]|uniref:DMT family transporter n=1 Tax=Fusobacterium sp. IOR10 TaxID=2665157 RepID=UPI0013D5AAA0|nr:DMT family transporter [Fusobacterium sp. IOR10]